MNLQRREEIRELIADQNMEDPQALTDCRNALAELLAHIDTLEQTAAERVIARGAVVKPHTFGEIVNQVRDIASQYAGTEQLRERIAYALAPHFERNAGPTPDYTGEGSAWAPPVEARAVVVPELTDECAEWQALPFQPQYTPMRGSYFAAFYNLARARAIPADRVLGEGMRQVDARRFERMQFEEAERPYLLELERYVRTMAKLQNWSKDTTDHGPLSSLDRLRANQGGAAT